VLCGFIEMVTEGIFVSLQREDFDDWCCFNHPKSVHKETHLAPGLSTPREVLTYQVSVAQASACFKMLPEWFSHAV
jgi:hypothetical protein